ncbi:Uncharacterised protein [Mycolicibacterium vanbaalenii]|uniref:Uncharacterized protein n=1 Tax=Mycolicibacterium vanbaalenii TaxID=110539 RepID=A0A5S9RBT6_MYCVN|nr:Uncharacterised protein [Mycolicibacterium vanbaalenii]
MSDENPFLEQPIEFAASMAATGGSCDAQSVLPVGDHYRCTCSCGAWTYEAGDIDEGLRRVRAHTSHV